MPAQRRAQSLSESDFAYFSRRAVEETNAAMTAQAEAAALHRILAERYALLAAAIQEAQEKLGTEY